MMSTLPSILSIIHLFLLTNNQLLEWDQIRNLLQTDTTLPTLFAIFRERGSQVVHFYNVRWAGVTFLGLDEGGAILIEE